MFIFCWLVIGEGDLDDFCFSKSSVHVQSNSAIQQKAIDIREDQKIFLQGKRLTLHFEGKLVKDFTDDIVIGVISTVSRMSSSLTK